MKMVCALLSILAYNMFWPYVLINFIHRVRGVKIHDLRNTVIAYKVLIDPIYPGEIEIEEGAWITQQCVVLAHFRPTPSMKGIVDGDRVKPVKICSGAYIGMKSIILPGVTIGARAVVGAGSVVTKDVPPDTVVAGNPAKVIKPTREIR